MRRDEFCAVQSVRRVAAMLDLDPDAFQDGAALPLGWHFFLLGGETRRSALRADGFPGFGLPMPDVGLPRLLLGGRKVTFRSALTIGERIERLSRIARVEQKQGASGPSAIVTLEHTLRPAHQSEAAVVETQTYILLPASKGTQLVKDNVYAPPVRGEMVVTPDETLLFQYSALGFNSHKIHLDQHHARDVEGLPDLVVNGGLATLLATEFLRRDRSFSLSATKTRHLAPLYCGRPITFSTHQDGQRIRLSALNEAGILAMELEAEVA